LTQINTLESASVQAQVFNTQSQAKNQLSNMKRDMDVDKVEDLMDDMRDLMDDNQQIQEAMGRPLFDQDTDELNDEFDALMSEGQELDLEEIKEDSPSIVVPNVPDGPILPNVPTGDVTVQHKSDDDKAIADLMAQMN
jgi:charged multivesicular body protein 4